MNPKDRNWMHSLPSLIVDISHLAQYMCGATQLNPAGCWVCQVMGWVLGQNMSSWVALLRVVRHAFYFTHVFDHVNSYLYVVSARNAFIFFIENRKFYLSIHKCLSWPVIANIFSIIPRINYKILLSSQLLLITWVTRRKAKKLLIMIMPILSHMLNNICHIYATII